MPSCCCFLLPSLQVIEAYLFLLAVVLRLLRRVRTRVLNNDDDDDVSLMLVYVCRPADARWGTRRGDGSGDGSVDGAWQGCGRVECSWEKVTRKKITK